MNRLSVVHVSGIFKLPIYTTAEVMNRLEAL